MGRKKNNRGGPTQSNNRQHQRPQPQPSQSAQSSQNVAENKSAQIAALGVALDAAIATPISIDDSSIDEAKFKLAQVQESVDAIKASLTQLKDEKVTTATENRNSDNGDGIGEAPFDTNTAKRKRNRNRKRNKGAGTKEATPTSDSNDESKSNPPSEQQKKAEAGEGSPISESKPSIQTEIVAKEPDKTIDGAAKSDDLKIDDANEVKAKNEEIPAPVIKSIEVAKLPKELKKSKAEVKPPIQAETLEAAAITNISGNAAISLEKTDKVEINVNSSKDQIVKPVAPTAETLDGEAQNRSASEKKLLSKRSKGDKNKASETLRVEATVIEVEENDEAIAKSAQTEPAPPKSPPKQPTSTTDSKKQPKINAKNQQQKPRQPQGEEKCKSTKPVGSVSPPAESKQDVPLPVIEEKKNQAEIKVDVIKPSTQQPLIRVEEQKPKNENVAMDKDINIERQPTPTPTESKPTAEQKPETENVANDEEKNIARQSSPKESKRKKNARNEKIEEKLVHAAKNVELKKPAEPAATSSTAEEPKNQGLPKEERNLDVKKSTEELPKKPALDPMEIVTKIEAVKATKSAPSKVESFNTTPPSTPTTVTPKEMRKAETVQDGDTSRIWKILEEASKSLEPVEIEMDEGLSLTEDKSPDPANEALTAVTVPIMKEVASDCRNVEILNSVLLEKKNVDEAKESQPKKLANTLASEKSRIAAASTSASAKAVQTQPRKSAEAKKKQLKPQAKTEKNPKSTKPNAPSQLSAENTAPVSNETSSADVEIPLDMSIILNASAEDAASSSPSPLDDANQTKESVTDSKNVQGSDFVPSVEQSSDEAKSLVATVATPNEEEKPATDSKSTAADSNQPAAEVKTRQIETSVKPKPPEAKSKSQIADVKPKNASKTKSVSPPKAVAANGNQTSSAEKKPSFPPKPDHLVSSKNKSKSETTAARTSQTDPKQLIADDDDEEVDYIEYKFMPRQVFICSICQACKASLQSDARVLCQLCQMITYCSTEHMQIDTAAHKELCTAIQEIAKKRGGHIYNNARVVSSNDYRSLRVHTLNICENLLKRPLQTFEREILLFPRLCGTASCREWRQNQLTDCPACHQVAYCTAHPEHMLENHQRWCKSFQLYEKLVVKQSVSGRIEPVLPTKIINKPYPLHNNIDDIFKDLYEDYAGKALALQLFVLYSNFSEIEHNI